MYRLFLFFSILFSLVQFNYAQTTTGSSNKKDVGIIIGNVLDIKTQKPVSFATLQLVSFPDTSKKILQVADKNGSFEFDKIPFALYKLYISATGYNTLVLDSLNVRMERFDFNLGDIKLTASISMLNEVVVYAEKPLIENRDGKIIYNVGESAASNSSSTAELLKNMPLVSSDPNGKVLLKGREPKILIDEKPTDLTADQLKDLLESLPGSSIERIELMTNPPAEYATEQGGVINIVTKKGRVGFTGRATLSVGSRGEGNLSTNISYRHRKYTFTSTFGSGAGLLNGSSYSYRQNFYKDSSNRFNTNSSFESKNLRPHLRMQFDYEINKYRLFSVTYQGNLSYAQNHNITQYTNINRFEEAYKFSTRDNDTYADGYNHGLGLSYTIKNKKNILDVCRIFLNGNIGKNISDRDYYQEYLNSSYLLTGDSTQNQFFNNYSKNISVRVNYDRPLKKAISISTGAAFLYNNNHTSINTTFLNKLDSSFNINDLLSNDFQFHQYIVTARLALIFYLKYEFKITVSAQAEFTNSAFKFIKANSDDVKSGYNNVLPNLTIRKDFGKKFNTSLVYRQTIRRPGIGEMNPNIDYSDPYNIRFGNPYLFPCLTDNFDWNFSWIMGKYYINASLGYNYVKNIFNTIRTLTDGGKTQVTWMNIANRKEYEASVFGGYTFSKKVRMNASAGFNFSKYGEQEKILYKYKDGSTVYTGATVSYLPNTLVIIDANARFSSYATPQGSSRSTLTTNFAISKKFMKKRLQVGFHVIDPFKQMNTTTFTYGTNYNLESYNSTRTRNFRLSVSYLLNKMVSKSSVSNKQKQNALQKVKKNN